ncbi:hypothetical protein PPERSA_06561 [Pseudocohnilembus persalinus]|uniref:EF-hand domain-containing protein n=1 Tax=Pseudocohnilembus persalinus TaxID=266149 RepID=A0A0V0QRK4_PSEPJ|nr:hypothetical protein PPERSA_06561 [Pseudocohnilembus persalinus]|eukprot:KRX04927.1 hypothetical protein PPERSA_06561 [Pseudocohnilembus persalinus]
MLEFHRDQNQKPPAYSNNVRFHLAKQKIQELFLKFLSQQTTGELVHQLIKDIKNKNLNISQIPHPLFTNQKLTLQSSLSNSLILNQSLKSPQKQQGTPPKQSPKGDTVIHRIFFMVNRQDNGQITWREFKNSQLFESLQEVDREEDINKVRNFFSYEHFYVIYCKFWELDQDHDFLITKDEFARYQGHGLSKKVVDRIFEGIPRKLKGLDGKMTYEDFIYFILAEEDKTTLTSIEYWFKLIDLDENGIITGYEMEYFYEEQRQRLEYLNHEIVFFQDVVCQMVDLLKPEDDIKFYLSHFKEEQHQCGVFFNILTNLNKFVSYEQRDPFGIRNELLEHPDFSDWDRFAQQEYLRLAMEEENNENAEIDVMDPWDGEVNQQQDNQQQDSPK